MTPITLTKTAVRAAVKRACERGKLAAMHPHSATGANSYPNGDRCAIGWALPAALAEHPDHIYALVEELIDEGLVKSTNKQWLRDVQLAHDQWLWQQYYATRAHPLSPTDGGSRAKLVKQSRRAFFKVVGIPDKYGD